MKGRRRLIKSTLGYQTRWDLVCSKRWLPVIVLTAFNASGFFGQCACLFIAKKFGKRVLFFSALLLQSASGVATAFSPNLICFAVFRCLAGMALPGVLIAPATLAHELTGWKQHSKVSLLCSAARSIGMVLLAGIVLFVGEWSNLALASSIPFYAFFLYSCRFDIFFPSPFSMGGCDPETLTSAGQSF
ncbi:solute carrier family 22 member 6-B [Caerostris extrusa]|uniref:Solute carrier family 22 member 6-B n=1 Tax=Caerostris extrusa TaxID=172846 RepID=A0AAV4RUG0_CAEEX|nr:solute carrier family 22 member 6-B [Caerostris extrusa]